MTTEHRIVCANFGTPGHNAEGHHKIKPTKAKVIQAVIDANHHAEMNPTGFYTKEAPWRRQEREVTEWEDIE